LQYGYNNDYYNNGSYWGGGRIAGVVIGCVCFVFAVVFCILAVLMRRRRMARCQVKHLSHLLYRLCTARCYIHHLAGEVISTKISLFCCRQITHALQQVQHIPLKPLLVHILKATLTPTRHTLRTQEATTLLSQQGTPRRLQPCYSRRLPSQGDSSGWVQWSADATSISREAWLPIRLSSIYLEIYFCF